jgi:hypothetical protein
MMTAGDRAVARRIASRHLADIWVKPGWLEGFAKRCLHKAQVLQEAAQTIEGIARRRSRGEAASTYEDLARVADALDATGYLDQLSGVLRIKALQLRGDDLENDGPTR